jgi:hypothetical protein
LAASALVILFSKNFKNFFFKGIKCCEGNKLNLQEYSHCGNEIVKINESCVKVAKVLWYINGTSEFSRKRKRKQVRVP